LPKTAPDPAARLASLKRRAALTLLWEGLWPPLAFAGAVALLFVAASWFGLWFEAPPYARLAALALFGLAFLAALWPLIRLRWPGRAPTLARLDRDADARHAPATAFEDRLANASDDPATQALWALHRERAARDVEALRVKPPAPRVALRDPYALRFVAVLLAAVGFLAAGPERLARIAAAFHGIPSLVPLTVPARVDAWIDPPAYTNKPPIFLKIGEGEPSRTLTAPEDSVLVVRADPQAVTVTTSGGLVGAPSPAPQERRFALHGDGEAKIDQGGALLADLTVKAAPRTPPVIRLLDPPQGNASGSLTLHYAVEDAYGVAELGGEAALTAPAPHLLYGPPPLALSAPAAPNGTGEGKSVVDLSEHPWAGAKTTLTLIAKSTSGASAKSPPVEITLPQRRFVNPLAKALVEQRRNLALDPDRNATRVARALAALRLGPDLFETSPRVFLDLDSLHDQLGAARNDNDLREVVVELWALALSIENGDASQALKELRSAEQNLRDALKRNASPEELKKLTQELKDAANRYLSEMAKNADKNAQEDAQDMDSKDLDAMLDRLERDTQEGAKEDAQAALDELQDTMENMQSAQNQKPDPAAKQMKKSMRDLEKLLKDQQALRNDTFREDQRERAGEAPSQDEKDPGRDLEQRQQALRDKLDDVEKQLRGAGVDTPKNLDDASGDMAQAQEDLKGEGEKGKSDQGKSKRRYGRTDKGDAVEEQGKAIEALRQGGQSLAQQMRGKGQGRQSFVGKPGGRQGDNSDPLGRGQNGKKGAAEGELSGGADHAERARRVLEELRRRLSDPNRPAEERDYLERLIGQP
jgi:uncharacterized protein (TIGR02302 family)